MPAYFDRTRPPLHAPVISLDVFDMPVNLPKVLRENVAEVMDDPAEWAKMNVKKYRGRCRDHPPDEHRSPLPERIPCHGREDR